MLFGLVWCFAIEWGFKWSRYIRADSVRRLHPEQLAGKIVPSFMDLPVQAKMKIPVMSTLTASVVLLYINTVELNRVYSYRWSTNMIWLVSWLCYSRLMREPDLRWSEGLHHHPVVSPHTGQPEHPAEGGDTAGRLQSRRAGGAEPITITAATHSGGRYRRHLEVAAGETGDSYHQWWATVEHTFTPSPLMNRHWWRSIGNTPSDHHHIVQIWRLQTYY